MLQLPPELVARYHSYLGRRGVNDTDLEEYTRWLRYFLDFCSKYPAIGEEPHQRRLFLGKLREKNRTEDQRRRALHAIILYKELKNLNESVADRQEYPAATLGIEPRNSHSTITKVSQYSEVGYQEKSSSPEWER